jgi:Cu+-exporting ATPase
MNTVHTTEAEAAPPAVSHSQSPRRALTELAVSGMTCGNCVRHVTQALQSVPGVQSAVVNLEAQQAKVRWSTEPDVQAIIKAVQDEGFGAQVIEGAATSPQEHKLAGWQVNLWIGVPATLLLMAGEWVVGLGTTPWFRWLSFVIAGIVQIFAGARFYRGAWSQLKARSSNMDTLVALGSSTAFGYSAWALLGGLGGHVYFMEAAAIITLISAGHWLESRMSVRASSALRSLLDLTPALARRRQPDGSELEVPVADLAPGDLVGLRPGDRIPTDGVVIEGASVVDESMLTGESAPVDKVPANQLYGGTTNLNGRLLMRVTAIGEETALAHIIAAVQRAQTSRANIQRLGDRVSNVFVPIVVAVGLAAGLWWGLAPESAKTVHEWVGRFLWPAHLPEGPLASAFIIAAAVLIVACPCAMGLATPAAIMAGANAAARRGILIRDGVALEKAGRVTAVLFDKTGTLTVGRPSVVSVWEKGQGQRSEARDQRSEIRDQMVGLATSLARHSTHPISQAVARLGRADDVEVADWEEVRGAGVRGKVQSPESTIQNPQSIPSGTLSDNGQVSRFTLHARLGSLRWFKESQIDLAPAQPFIAEWSAQGATLVGLAVDNVLLGMFAVQDTLKAGAAGVVAELQRQGLNTYLVTGDGLQTAQSIARQAGIGLDRVFAEVRPEQKAELAKRLQQQGERVAFVGDGINDAPALEQADLGIAVSRASDIAREAADIILLKSEVEAVPESLSLARATLRTIKQNLFWAFFYNSLGVPLAALGFMSPILCAAAMGLSDVVVIGNALRLRNWKRRSL